MNKIINNIGYNGPFIIYAIVIYCLRQSPYFILFIASSLLNVFICKGLKILIKEKRPSNPDNYTGEELYGMPSGHAQHSFFAVTFLHLATRWEESKWFQIAASVLSINTVYQRIESNSHTPIQLVAGAFVGSAFAYIIFFIYNYYIGNVAK